MTVTSRSAGDLLTAAIFNGKLEAPIQTSEIGAGQITTALIADGNVTVAKLATIPSAVVRHSVDQSIANGVDTALAFDSEVMDTDAIHGTATNKSRLTRVTAAKYLIAANVSFASNTAGFRAIWIRKNGTTLIARQIIPPVNGERTELCLAVIESLSASDYVECLVYQSSGGALNCQAISSRLPQFAMDRVSA